MNPLDQPRRRRHVTVLLVALVSVVFTAACSNGDDDALADTESVDSSQASSESGDSGAGQSESNATEGSEGGEVLGTARATLPSPGSVTVPLRLDVVRLERHDDLVEVTAHIVNEAPEPTGDEDALDYSPYSSFGGDRYDVSNVGLVDASNQKLYLAIIDSDDVCVCTTGTSSVTMQPGDAWTITATIGGVPDDVEQLDVRVPGFPNVTGITLR